MRLEEGRTSSKTLDAAGICRPGPRRSEYSLSRLNPIDYKRFEKFLFYVGCEFVRQKGDHRIYQKTNLKCPVVVPAIKDIPVFIILNNLRILGISKEEYISLLENI